jgi:uncharacterized protein (DUF1330 family)
MSMAAYIVATTQIHDPERFAAYGQAIQGLSAKFGGEPLVRGAVAEFLEGDGAPGERVVVSRYPDAESARAYIQSAEYQAAHALRDGAATVVMRLLID